MEATISVICFKSKTLANGEHPLMLRITKDRRRSMKSLSLSIHAKYWDFKKNEPKSNCPNRTLINQIIIKARLEAQKKLLEKQVNNEEFTSESFIHEKKEEVQIKAKTVEEFYMNTIEELRKSGKVGNSYAYLNSYNSLKAFSKGKKLNFTFSAINSDYLNKYEEWLRQKDNKEITISYQFRTLRAIYNKAIDARIVSSEKNPFRAFKVGKFNTKTQKRALSKEEIMRIINFDSSNLSVNKQLAQDIFSFSYLCGGISFVDIANLTMDNIQNNRLIYKRQKTNGKINLPLSDKAFELIDKYKLYQQEAKYLLPILHVQRHISPMQKRNRVHKVCHQINKDLRILAKELGIKSEVTTYVARHSFATILKRSGVNIAIISESLGHSDLSTTQIYLDSFENSQIDEAMKNLL